MGKEGEGEREKENGREIERGWVRCSARPESMMSSRKREIIVTTPLN